VKLLRSEQAGEALAFLTDRRQAAYTRVRPAARRIVGTVRRGGDAALLRQRAKLDGLDPSVPLRVATAEMRAAWASAPAPLRQALTTAARRLRAFAARQRPRDFSFAPVPGLRVGQRVVPLDAVGCYVPGGRYPLPSTLLMTVIPAQAAGVARIAVVCPRPAPEILAAAHVLGVTELYRVGGAHAIGALAYGTASIPPVQKIVGPGNAWVTAAKELVAPDCAIDMLAGPTEIAVVSERGDPALIAADLVAQAEHDPDAVGILLTSRVGLARAVRAEVGRRVLAYPVAAQALGKRGLILVTANAAEARYLANRIAPEHLTVDAAGDLAWVRNAGSVFVGRWSAQPLGDYVSGPNHTLPTSGQARLRGGLSVLDFVKLITVQTYTRGGVRRLGPAALSLARAEGLGAHAAAIVARGARA